MDFAKQVSQEKFDEMTSEQRVREIGNLIIEMREILTKTYIDQYSLVYELPIDRGEWDHNLMVIEDHLTRLFPGWIGSMK